MTTQELYTALGKRLLVSTFSDCILIDRAMKLMRSDVSLDTTIGIFKRELDDYTNQLNKTREFEAYYATYRQNYDISYSVYSKQVADITLKRMEIEVQKAQVTLDIILSITENQK